MDGTFLIHQALLIDTKNVPVLLAGRDIASQAANAAMTLRQRESANSGGLFRRSVSYLSQTAIGDHNTCLCFLARKVLRTVGAFQLFRQG